MEYRVYLAGPTSIIELRVRDINTNEAGVEEDGNYWLDDLMIPPERLIAIVSESHVKSVRVLGQSGPNIEEREGQDETENPAQ